MKIQEVLVLQSETNHHFNYVGYIGFPSGSNGKESASNVGDLGLIPGLERSLKEGMATHSSVLAGRILMDRGTWQATVHGVTKSWTRLSD